MTDLDYSDLVEAALQAKTIADIHGVCSRLCERFGFDFFHYGAQLPTSMMRPEFIFISGFPNEWWQRYNEQGYMQVDPIVAHTLSHVTPLVWDGDRKVDAPGVPEIHRFVSEARDFGIKTGVTFPVHGVNGEIALLSLIANADRVKTDERLKRAMPVANLVTSYVHEAVRRVSAEGILPLQRVELTPRERECLMWTAEGKTTWEISKILGISERTVTFHLQNVTEKLNASNRSHAVARAVSQQIIMPQLSRS